MERLSRGLSQAATRGPAAAVLLGLVFGFALGPCAFAWIAPLLGVTWMQAAEGLTLPVALLAAFALGQMTGILLAGGALARVQRWLDTLGRRRGFAYGRIACGGLLLTAAGALIASS